MYSSSTKITQPRLKNKKIKRTRKRTRKIRREGKTGGDKKYPLRFTPGLRFYVLKPVYFKQ
jgi:hypothetical protein